jgi:uncharacterized protein YjbI with pentapeptide repeats
MPVETSFSIVPPRLPRKLASCNMLLMEDQGQFTSAAFVGIDLAGLSAAGVTFEQSRFHRANLTGTRLEGARFLDVCIEASDLSGGIWDRLRLRRCELKECRLLGVQWLEAELSDVAFVKCDLEGAKLHPPSHLS